MERCNKIYNHPLYRERIQKIVSTEADRIFCLHNLEHSLDVARIGYITILEADIDISKEVFYSAALLHDIGRCDDKPHSEYSAELTRIIMPECGFSNEETELVANAVCSHTDGTNDDILSRILYNADKKSRLCFTCKAQNECYWGTEKRNLEINI